MKRHELQLLRQRLEQTAHHRQVQQVDAMKAELDALLATQKECAAVVKDGRVRIVELERQVSHRNPLILFAFYRVLPSFFDFLLCFI